MTTYYINASTLKYMQHTSAKDKIHVQHTSARIKYIYNTPAQRIRHTHAETIITYLREALNAE